LECSRIFLDYAIWFLGYATWFLGYAAGSLGYAAGYLGYASYGDLGRLNVEISTESSENSGINLHPKPGRLQFYQLIFHTTWILFI
jgi:hypothetical protein